MNFRHSIAAIGLACSLAAFGQVLPYQNPELSARERAADLCSRLTLDEKASLMMNSSPAIDRLGIPAFDWWNEALHGVGRNGIATVFPSCIGLAATFNDNLISEIYTAVSDEARAKNTYARSKGEYGRYKGLSFWTPNINVFRDPRWGRGQETYGEDPYMNGRMGSRVVRALQGNGQNDKYRKLLACAKHYAVHSGPEKTRHQFDVTDLPPRDLWETYLPAFEALVKDGGVRQVMCAYQRIDGQACCGSDRLLQQILREEWGYDGVVVSDCGAIGDFLPQFHNVAKDDAAASALGALSGTDVECGSVYTHIPEAVRRGDISEEDLDKNVIRLLTERISLGNLDADSLVSWTSIPYSVVDSPEHRQLAREAARQSMVLLKNDGLLPLKKAGQKIMVMGPNAADSTMQWGIYYGTPSHTVTILEGIESKIGKVPYRRASTITELSDSTRDSSESFATDIDELVAWAKDADVVIFVGGISPALEKEEAKVEAPGFDDGDRTSIELPQCQRDILAALHRVGKPVVFVNCSGSAVALTPEDKTCNAILEAWYPGEEGGNAVADILFGDYNPQGKLPVTFYASDSQLPPFDEYRMDGRTYRYLHNAPLYPFGHGLSYTKFSYGAPAYADGVLSVDVTNTGKVEGTEIVQAYIRRPSDVNGPKMSLRGYERVTLAPGQTKTVTIALPRESFKTWNEANQRMGVVPGLHEIFVGPSSVDYQSISVDID